MCSKLLVVVSRESNGKLAQSYAEIQQLLTATMDTLNSAMTPEELIRQLSYLLPMLPEVVVKLGGQSPDYLFERLGMSNGNFSEVKYQFRFTVFNHIQTRS